ncbi:TetR/AcrR family transcriptional regulator [Amantichitinum ursilacus]|nr:TetR/AcrR family transcriptional regulator [Amantichitinum ursilacus]
MNSQSRSSQTRQALLDAARQLLIEQGYARLAETRVCDRAGVSRGALRYHFPEGLLDLLPALLDELIDIEGGKIDPAGLFNPRERMYLALYGLAHAQGQTDSLAVLELWMAARGDERLAERLNPIMDSADRRIFGFAPDAPFEPDLLAWRLMLHGASLHVFSLDYDRAKLTAALQWVLKQWPMPESLQQKLAARRAEATASASSESTPNTADAG